MQIFLEPEDVWLFRDGKPFDAGSDHRAHSLFPPYLTAIQGAIRSHQLILENVNLSDKKAIEQKVGTATNYGELKMRGAFLASMKDAKLIRYFPLPADAMPISDNEMKSIPPKQMANGQVTSLGMETRLFMPPDFNPGKRKYGTWLSETDLKKCLNGESVRPVESNALFLRESRFGIQIKDNLARVTEEGRLYQAEFIRPCAGVGLYVEFSGYAPWPDAGLLRLGGEGHAARYRKVTPPDWPVPPTPLPEQFKVYFATPAYFSQGWKPASWSRFFDQEVTLEAVALTGYETIGGYDWANNQQRTARRFVPAGSVYYFSNPQGAKLQPNLIQNAITESFEDHDDIAKIGFGQVFITEWKGE